MDCHSNVSAGSLHWWILTTVTNIALTYLGMSSLPFDHCDDRLFIQVLILSLKDRGRSAGSMSALILTFWCATFAKEATVVYPEKLRKSLAQFRRQGGRIELPGWQEDLCDDDASITIVADSMNGHQVISS